MRRTDKPFPRRAKTSRSRGVRTAISLAEFGAAACCLIGEAGLASPLRLRGALPKPLTLSPLPHWCILRPRHHNTPLYERLSCEKTSPVIAIAASAASLWMCRKRGSSSSPTKTLPTRTRVRSGLVRNRLCKTMPSAAVWILHSGTNSESSRARPSRTSHEGSAITILAQPLGNSAGSDKDGSRLASARSCSWAAGCRQA